MKKIYKDVTVLADYAMNKNNSIVDRATAYQVLLVYAKKLNIDLKYISDDFSDIKIYLSKIKK